MKRHRSVDCSDGRAIKNVALKGLKDEQKGQFLFKINTIIQKGRINYRLNV